MVTLPPSLPPSPLPPLHPLAPPSLLYSTLLYPGGVPSVGQGTSQNTIKRLTMASECQGKKTCNAFCPASRYAVQLRSAVSAQWPKRGQGKEGEGGVKLMQVRDSWHTENNQTPKHMEYLVRQRITGGLRTSLLLRGSVFARMHNSLVKTHAWQCRFTPANRRERK